MTTLFLAAQRSTTQAGDARLICRPGPFLQGLTLLYMPIRLDLGERRGLRFLPMADGTDRYGLEYPVPQVRLADLLRRRRLCHACSPYS
jgi:hypothetical protein